MVSCHQKHSDFRVDSDCLRFCYSLLSSSVFAGETVGERPPRRAVETRLSLSSAFLSSAFRSSIFEQVVRTLHMAQLGSLPNPPAGLGRLAGGLLGVLSVGYGVTQSLFNVEGGHRAIVFNRFQGIKEQVQQPATLAVALP